MPLYRAPVEDFRFLFHEVLELEKHRDLPGFAELAPELADAPARLTPLPAEEATPE